MKADPQLPAARQAIWLHTRMKIKDSEIVQSGSRHLSMKHMVVWRSSSGQVNEEDSPINYRSFVSKEGSSGPEKIVLSLHKFPAIIFNED
ncbi:hypothetical protein Tco_0757392 [Tanacetum coccineum]